MDYLLFEKGKILPKNAPSDEIDIFYLPLNMYRGNPKISKDKLTECWEKQQGSNLDDLFDKIVKDVKNIHLGIGIKLSTIDG